MSTSKSKTKTTPNKKQKVVSKIIREEVQREVAKRAITRKLDTELQELREVFSAAEALREAKTANGKKLAAKKLPILERKISHIKKNIMNLREMHHEIEMSDDVSSVIEPTMSPDVSGAEDPMDFDVYECLIDTIEAAKTLYMEIELDAPIDSLILQSIKNANAEINIALDTFSRAEASLEIDTNQDASDRYLYPNGNDAEDYGDDDDFYDDDDDDDCDECNESKKSRVNKKVVEAVNKPVFTEKNVKSIMNKLSSTFLTIPPHPMRHADADVMRVELGSEKVDDKLALDITVSGSIKGKVGKTPTEVVFRWLDDGTFTLYHHEYPGPGNPPKLQPKVVTSLEQVRQTIISYMKTYYDNVKKTN